MVRKLSLSKRESKREIQGLVGTSYRTRSTSYKHATDALAKEDGGRQQQKNGSHISAVVADEQSDEHVP